MGKNGFSIKSIVAEIVFNIFKMLSKANLNKITIVSYEGKFFSCNPRAFVDYIIENNIEKFKLIVVLNDKSSITDEEKNFMKI